MSQMNAKHQLVEEAEMLLLERPADTLARLAKVVEAWNRTPWGEGPDETLAKRFYDVCRQLRQISPTDSRLPVRMGKALPR